MVKTYWLKKSYLKYKINNVLFSLFHYFIFKNKQGTKVLITQLDGIGDIVVRQGLVKLIAEKYGKENIVLLITYGSELVELEGYDYEIFEKNSHYDFFKLLKLYKKLSQYNFLRLYSLEFASEDKIDFLKKFRFEEVCGFKGGFLDRWPKKNVKLTEKKGKKIIEILYNYAVNLVDPDIKIQELKPKINIPTSEQDYIAVGIGSSDKKKMASPKKLSEFLNTILKAYPDTKFHILGNGRNDEVYYKDIEKIIDNKNLVNYVSKLSLIESSAQIANAKLYIGFDSGLYNIAYSLNKKQICIISLNRNQHFFHEDEKIKFIYKELNFEQTENSIESIYNNDIDLISPEIFYHYFNLMNE